MVVKQGFSVFWWCS